MKFDVLRPLSQITGAVCALIGLGHVLFGANLVIGLDNADANEDSQERFFGGVFVGYGAAWLWVGTQRPVPSSTVRALSATMALGGVGWALSMRARRKPHRFWVAMTGVELVPLVMAWLARADENESSVAA